MRSFTLLESVIAMGIVIVLLAGVYMALSVAQVSWDSGEGMIELQQSVRRATDVMVRELRRSKPSGVTVSGTDAERVDFIVPRSAKTIAYWIYGTQLRREHPSGTFQVLANDVNNLSFCCVGGASCFDCANASIVQVVVGAGKTVKGRSLRQFDLTDEVSLRNE